MSRKLERLNDLKQRQVDERRRLVAEYMLAGVRTHRDIIQRLKDDHNIEVSEATMTRDVKALKEIYRETATEAIDEERGITLMRLEGYVERVVNRLHRLDKLRAESDVDETMLADDEKATIRLAKELEESRRKMLGLDMPSKIAHTDPTGTKEYTGIPESFKDRFFGEVEHEPIQEIEEAEVVEDE